MSDFYYGQAISADDLNNIAVDLGRNDFSEFANEEPYAVTRLNDITAALVGKGITSAAEKLAVTSSGESIIIGTGVGIFENGQKFRLKNPLTLPFSAGEVFIENDKTLNKATLKIGVLPEDNDFIHLATVSEDGTVTDRRTLAKAKVELPTEGNSYKKTITLPGGREFIFSVPIEGGSKLLFESGTYFMVLFDVEKRTFTGFDAAGAERQNETFFNIGDRHETCYLENITDASATFKIDDSLGGISKITFNIYAFGGI